MGKPRLELLRQKAWLALNLLQRAPSLVPLVLLCSLLHLNLITSPPSNPTPAYRACLACLPTYIQYLPTLLLDYTTCTECCTLRGHGVNEPGCSMYQLVLPSSSEIALYLLIPIACNRSIYYTYADYIASKPSVCTTRHDNSVLKWEKLATRVNQSINLNRTEREPQLS